MSLKPATVQHVQRNRERIACFTLWLDPALEYFQGHFPIAPILPGVVQLGWAIRYAKEAFPHSGTFQGIEALKFQQVLRPGETVELELEHRPEKKAVLFRYRSERGRHSSGTLFLG